MELGKVYAIEWEDSWGSVGGWLHAKHIKEHLGENKPVVVTSVGLVVGLSEDTVVLGQSWSEGNDVADPQINGIFGIPIRTIKSFKEIEL